MWSSFEMVSVPAVDDGCPVPPNEVPSHHPTMPHGVIAVPGAWMSTPATLLVKRYYVGFESLGGV
jgi:hypothetical protein